MMSPLTKTLLSLGGLLLTGPLRATVHAEQQMQLDFYADDACALYASSVAVTWADLNALGNCFNYNQGLSANIAACYEAGCYCMFYSGANCVGAQASAVWTGHNCVPNSMDYQSFSCAYSS